MRICRALPPCNSLATGSRLAKKGWMNWYSFSPAGVSANGRRWNSVTPRYSSNCATCPLTAGC